MLHTIEFEPVVQDHLYIACGALADEAEAICGELDALPEELWQPTMNEGFDRVYGGSGEIDIKVNGLFYQDKPLVGVSTLGSVAILPIFLGREQLVINRQSPLKQQDLHPDQKARPTFVLQLSPDGAFDYLIPGHKEPFGVGVGVGDVIENRTDIAHRGRNPSSVNRYTVVLFSPRKPASSN